MSPSLTYPVGELCGQQQLQPPSRAAHQTVYSLLLAAVPFRLPIRYSTENSSSYLIAAALVTTGQFSSVVKYLSVANHHHHHHHYVPNMTYNVFGGTLNLTQLATHHHHHDK